MLTRIVNTVSAFIMLVSTTGMTVNMHFCMDRLYAVGINRPAESCCEHGKGCMESCERNSGDRCRHGFLIGRPGHCSDRSVHTGNTDDYVVSTSGTDMATGLHPVPSPGIQAINADPSSHEFLARRTVYKYCKPPPLPKTELSIFQSFLT